MNIKLISDQSHKKKTFRMIHIRTDEHGNEHEHMRYIRIARP